MNRWTQQEDQKLTSWSTRYIIGIAFSISFTLLFRQSSDGVDRGSLADQGLLKDQDITGFIEINAQETLEQAIRKAAQQPMTKCNDLC